MLLCDCCGTDMERTDYEDSTIEALNAWPFPLVSKMMIGLSLIVQQDTEGVVPHPEAVRFRNTFGKDRLNFCMTCLGLKMGAKPRSDEA